MRLSLRPPSTAGPIGTPSSPSIPLPPFTSFFICQILFKLTHSDSGNDKIQFDQALYRKKVSVKRRGSIFVFLYLSLNRTEVHYRPLPSFLHAYPLCPLCPLCPAFCGICTLADNYCFVLPFYISRFWSYVWSGSALSIYSGLFNNTGSQAVRNQHLHSLKRK